MAAVMRPRCVECGATAGSLIELETTEAERQAEPGCPRHYWKCLRHLPKVGQRRRAVR
jgi:hypothetical protein